MKKQKLLPLLLIAFMLIMSFTPAIVAEEMTLTLDKTEVKRGDTIQLTGTSFPKNSSIRIILMDKNNSTKYDSTEVVNSDGSFTLAIKTGNQWDTGTYTFAAGIGKDVATVTFEVVEEGTTVSVTGVSLNKTSLTFKEGDSGEQLIATVQPENASNKNVSWSSSDEKVAKVDNKGFVTPVSQGTAIITVTTEDGGFTEQCTVTVNRRSSGGGGGGGGSTVITTPTSTPEPTATPVPTQPPVDNNVFFTDLDGVEWAVESINALAAKGILSGVGDNKFAPNDNVTRAQFIKMLISAFELVDETATCDFTDVEPEAWYYPYIASAKQLGITSGYPDGTFGVDREITRQEMASLAYRTAKLVQINLPESTDNTDFVDNGQIAEYAREAIMAMKEAGIINGVGENRFAPHDTATRAQAAKIIYGLLMLK